MPKVTRHAPVLAAGIMVVLVVFASLIPSGQAAEPEVIGPEVSPAAASLLHLLNTAPEAKLRNTPGMTSEVLTKLMAHRATGGKLKNLVEFGRLTEVKPTDLELLLKPFLEEQATREMEADRKPVPTPGAPGKAGRLQRNAGGTDPNAQAGPAGPIGAVRPGFYSKLPGYEDLDKIDPLKRTEFLETVNREMCSCGCKEETVAFCLVNDQLCPVVKARARKIYDDIMTKGPR
jgi:hypothetical protein